MRVALNSNDLMGRELYSIYCTREQQYRAQKMAEEDDQVTYTMLLNIAKEQFPDSISIDLTPGTTTVLYKHVSTTNEINIKDRTCQFYKHLTEMINLTIGRFYRDVQGRYWKADKLEEMKAEPLIYIWYSITQLEILQFRKSNFLNIKAFVSFMYTEEDSQKILYLYEIHVDSHFQKARLGSKLLRCFHSCADIIKKNKPCVGTELTVFTQNEVAYNWYRKNGYLLTGEFEEDQKSDYYILFRPTIESINSRPEVA